MGDCLGPSAMGKPSTHVSGPEFVEKGERGHKPKNNVQHSQSLK